MSVGKEEIEALAIDTLYEARDNNQDMHEAARLIVKAVTPFIQANILRSIVRDGYVDVARCEEWANRIEFLALHPPREVPAS